MRAAYFFWGGGALLSEFYDTLDRSISRSNSLTIVSPENILVLFFYVYYIAKYYHQYR